MTADTLRIESRLARTRGRESRTQSIATRFTQEEEKALIEKAEAQGRNLREWARDVLLREAYGSTLAVGSDQIMTEIVALQLFLTNALSPVACGERMSAEQYQELMRNVKTNKHRAAREVVAQYAAENEEKKRHA
jgi:repressor of nif and glnA expression